MSDAIARVDVWRRLGEPAEQVGSANESRSQHEHGVEWNEKWVYRARESQRAERVVLWYRGDFRGVFEALPDGSWQAADFALSQGGDEA